MAYTRSTWNELVGDPGSAVSALKMNNIEQGILDAHTLLSDKVDLVDMDAKADLVNNVIPLSQIPKSSVATVSTIAQRTSRSTLQAAAATDPADLIRLDQLDAAVAASGGVYRHFILASTELTGLSSTSDTAWISLPASMGISDAKTGDIWKVYGTIKYKAEGSSTGGGIQWRMRPSVTTTFPNGPTTTAWNVDGYLYGLSTAATSNQSYSGLVPISYGFNNGGGSGLGGAFGGPNTALSIANEGRLFFELTVTIAGTTLTGRTINFDFMQRNTNATYPTTVLQGSEIIYSKIAQAA